MLSDGLEDCESLDPGAKRHEHADMNDPWPGMVYQAMHGGVEYVWVSGNHTWADFDAPPFDPQADMADFAERAGEHVTSLDVRTWVTWIDVSRPPTADEVVPIWQVIEWDLKSTTEGIQAVHSAFAKVKAAADDQNLPLRYTVNELVGLDGAPQMFVAMAHSSMAEMDAAEPYGLQRLLAQVYGHADAVQIMRAFETYPTPTANRIWTLRPDLSHMPGM